MIYDAELYFIMCMTWAHTHTHTNTPAAGLWKNYLWKKTGLWWNKGLVTTAFDNNTAPTGLYVKHFTRRLSIA